MSFHKNGYLSFPRRTRLPYWLWADNEAFVAHEFKEQELCKQRFFSGTINIICSDIKHYSTDGKPCIPLNLTLDKIWVRDFKTDRMAIMEGLVRPLKTRKFMTLSALNRIDGLGVRPKVDESGQVIQPVHESPIMVMDFVDDTAYHESMFEQYVEQGIQHLSNAKMSVTYACFEPAVNTYCYSGRIFFVDNMNNIPVPQHHKPYASSLSSQYTLLYDLAIYAHDTIDGRPKVINPYDVVDLMEHKDTVSEISVNVNWRMMMVGERYATSFIATGVQKVIDKNLSKVKDCRPIEIITLCSLRSKRQERHRGTTAAFLIFDNPVKGQAFWHIMQTELSSIGHVRLMTNMERQWLEALCGNQNLCYSEFWL